MTNSPAYTTEEMVASTKLLLADLEKAADDALDAKDMTAFHEHASQYHDTKRMLAELEALL